MSGRLRVLIRRPQFVLGLAAFLLAVVVQSGELGTSDTMHRLQTAHSFWTSEPAVFPEEYPEFGLHGRNGKLYDWYGIGQPLLLVPFDVAGTYVARLSILGNFGANYDGNGPSVRNIVVVYCVNSLMSVLTALVCFHLLRLFEFTIVEATAAVLALLFCTTHLHYTQNMMENSYILLLTLTGFAFQYKWLRTGSRKALVIGSAAFGLNLLTRLTTVLDLLAGAIFLWLVLRWEGARSSGLRDKLANYAKTALPIYAVFLLIDRAYQYYRYGTIFSTYMKTFADEYHRLDPSLPASYPFSTPFRVGFLGPLITPEKSIFLFDPLLILTIILAVVAWRRFRAEIKAYLATTLVLILGYMCLYAKYMVWSGDFAWGDRYVSTAVELAAFISVPLLLKYRRDLERGVWALGVGLIAVSAAVQVASLAFWLPLEIYQMETLGHPTFVIALRFKNIVAFALGKMNAWGLANHAMMEDPWDYIHITTWNFLPFVLRRVGEAPRWVVNLALALWGASVVSLGGSLWWMRKVLAGAPCDPTRGI